MARAATEASRERRWIILGEDGRHVTMGRHSDPSSEELEQVKASLADQGLSGWLVVMEGSYHQPRNPTLMMIQPLCKPTRAFSEAVDAFQAARLATLDGSH